MNSREAKEIAFNAQFNLLTKWRNELEFCKDESTGLIEAQRDAFDNAINILKTRADNFEIKLEEKEV